MTRLVSLLTISLAFIVSAQPARAADNPNGPPALEKKLQGKWLGPACGGDWTYAANGTFEAEHYSPGNNQLTGTWEVRWNTLPPTLVRTCKTSDDPDVIGKTWEVKLLRLDDELLAYQYPDQYPDGHTVRYTRMKAPPALERVLYGEWKAEGDCIGDLSLRADGTFERRHYSPGNNTLSGNWTVRWNALPPTLVLACTASDESDKVSVGTTLEVKILQLDDATLAYENPHGRGGQPILYTRSKE